MKNSKKYHIKFLLISLGFFVIASKAALRQTEPGKTRVPDNLSSLLNNESDAIKTSCAEFDKHIKYWEEKWPHHEVFDKNRGGNLLKSCYASIHAKYGEPSLRANSESTRKENEAAILIADAKALEKTAKTEHEAASKKAKETEDEGRELLKESNAIKGKGDRLFNDGEVDQAKTYLAEAKNRKEKGDALIIQGQKMIVDANKKLDETTAQVNKMLVKAAESRAEGEKLKKESAELDQKNVGLRNIVCPEGKCDTHDW